MQYKFFRIPVRNSEAFEKDLNSFLASVKVISVKENFIDDGENSSWAFKVEYFQDMKKGSGRKTGSVDYKEVLSESEFAVFSRLRELRKSLAEEEGVPVYAIFTNEQLAEMARNKVLEKTDMKKIDGIGDSKIEKYSEKFLKLMKELGG